MRLLPAGLVCLLALSSSPAPAERGSPDLEHAMYEGARNRRDKEIITGFARGFVALPARCEPTPWPLFTGEDRLGNAQLQLARLASAAYMLAWPDDFKPGWQQVVDSVGEWCEPPGGTSFRDKLKAYLGTILLPQPEVFLHSGGSIGRDGPGKAMPWHRGAATA